MDSVTSALASNTTVTEETLSREEEVSFLIPATSLTARSILFVMRSSISSGDAPGSTVVMMATGTCISGDDSRGIVSIE